MEYEMKVSIEGFRQQREFSKEFTKGNSYLLTGRSGCGKSTIFQAISWCLYGAEQGVETWTKEKEYMCVQVEMTDMQVHRQRNKTLLCCVVDGVTYQGPVAQSMINEKFGTHDIWCASVHMEVESFNPIISLPPAGKLELLNSIGCGMGNPRDYTTKISSELKSIETSVGVVQSSLASDINSFNRVVAEQRIDPANARDERTISDLTSKTGQLQHDIQVMSKAREVLIAHISERDTLSRELLSVENELFSLAPVDEGTISQREEGKIKYQEWLRQKKIVTDTSNSIKQLYWDIGDCPRYTTKDYESAVLKRSTREIGIRLARELGVGYDAASIQKEIDRLTYCLSHSDKLESNTEISLLQSEIERLRSSRDNTVSISISDAYKEMNELDQSRNHKECPGCGTMLTFTPTGLQKACSEVKFNHERYLYLIKAAQAATINAQIDSKISDLISHIGDRVMFELPPDVVLVNPHSLARLKEIVVVESGGNPDHISRAIQYWVVRDDLSRLEEKLLSMGDIPPVDSVKLDQDKENITKRRMLTSRLLALKDRLDSLSTPQGSLDDMMEKMNFMSSTLSQMNHIITESGKTNLMLAQMNNLNERTAQLAAIRGRCDVLTRLKTRAIHLECSSLEDVVSSINQFIEAHAYQIFTDPISIRLSLYKTIKSTGVDKPCVNIQINYKGGVLADITRLSVGEKGRINLLLTLAVQNTWGVTGLLIADESLAGLDPITKDKCRSLIKKTNPDMIIMSVDHAACEGMYDHILEL